MTSGVTVSVVLATYNSEKFLREQLESLARQKRLPDELVVGDDGSNDRTLDILREFSAQAPFPVVIIQNPVRLGYADNFLGAARNATGQLIAFCDHDDVWHQDKLAHCTREFDQPDVKLVIHDMAEVEGDLKLIGYAPGIRRPFTLQPREEYRRLPWIAGCAEVTRREIVEEVIRRWPVDHTRRAKDFGGKLISHDVVVFFIANALGKIHYVPEPLIMHRFHGKNVTSSASAVAKRKVRFSASVGRDEYRHEARVWRAQASLLTQMAKNGGDAAVTQALMEKANAFMRIALRARVRARIYQERNPLARLRMIAKARGRGIYVSDLGKYRYRSILKDLATALVLRQDPQREL